MRTPAARSDGRECGEIRGNCTRGEREGFFARVGGRDVCGGARADLSGGECEREEVDVGRDRLRRLGYVCVCV